MDSNVLHMRCGMNNCVVSLTTPLSWRRLVLICPAFSLAWLGQARQQAKDATGQSSSSIQRNGLDEFYRKITLPPSCSRHSLLFAKLQVLARLQFQRAAM